MERSCKRHTNRLWNLRHVNKISNMTVMSHFENTIISLKRASSVGPIIINETWHKSDFILVVDMILNSYPIITIFTVCFDGENISFVPVSIIDFWNEVFARKEKIFGIHNIIKYWIHTYFRGQINDGYSYQLQVCFYWSVVILDPELIRFFWVIYLCDRDLILSEDS